MDLPQNKFISFLKEKQLKKHDIIHLNENRNEKQNSWIFTLKTNNPRYVRIVLEPERPQKNKSTFLYLVEYININKFRNKLREIFCNNPYNSRGYFPDRIDFGGIKQYALSHKSFESWSEQINEKFQTEDLIF